MKGQQYVDDIQLDFSLSSITVRLKKCLDSTSDWMRQDTVLIYMDWKIIFNQF